jgi:plastocyanin
MTVRRPLIGILVALLAPVAPASAANQTVTATNFNTFSPRNVTVNTGDTVTWNNGGGFHNVHFDDNSYVQPPSASSSAWSVARTFSAPGTFRYYCDAHGGPNGAGMSGTVWVNGPGYPRPRSATPLRASLALAYRQCQAASANRTHGPPLEHPSCTPPAQASDWLTVGTPDANGPAANSIGSARLVALTGDPGTPADEADVRLVTSITDVRSRTSGLPDYTGELQARLALRITDRLNGPSLTETGTGDTTFTFAVPCTATGNTGVGSTCTVNTTADALAPGTVLEGKRAVWQVGKIELFDGGADGVASTAGNTLFADQSMFVP